jgi:uncharacterized membrane protein YhaH (DUF805 family)
MTFTESIKTCLTKYADFKGCASRSEFWWWALAIFGSSFLLNTITRGAYGVSPLYGLFSLITFIPSIAVATRRLHDTDRTGWLQLLNFVPVIGWIVLIIFYAQEGKKSTRYLVETNEPNAIS